MRQDNKTRYKKLTTYHKYFKSLKMISEPKLVSAYRKAFYRAIQAKR
jgi:hypothetical protein